jgi:hypothetical protein
MQGMLMKPFNYKNNKKVLRAAIALLSAGASNYLLADSCPTTISSAFTTSCTLLGGESLTITNTG